VSSGPTYTTLWRASDYSCVFVTDPDTARAEVHIYKGSTVIGFETCVDREDAAVIAERLRSALIEPA
jgi:hypothetical protein